MNIKTLLLKIILIATIGFISQTPVIAGVYKWVDENGQVHYGERPGSTGAERVTIRETPTNKPVVTEDDKTKKDSEVNADANAETTEEDTDKDSKEPAKVEKPGISKKEKMRLCKEGKQDYKNISSRGRMREINKSGEYTYLSEKQRQKRLAAAKKKKQKYCR